MATATGTGLFLGAGTITGSYVVQTRGDGDKMIDMEDFFNQDGALITRVVYNSFIKITLDALCITGALPETDFAMGAMAVHTDFTLYWVNSLNISRSKGAKRITVELEKIGI